MEGNQEKNLWIGKKVLIELFKEGVRLTYTATILSMDSVSITFSDKYGDMYSYNRNLITRIQEFKDAQDGKGA